MALTPHSTLRLRLATYLKSVGGAARRRDALDAMDDLYGTLWTEDDLRPQNTRQFETKWRNRTSFERQRMVEAGLLEARADGIWALTSMGRAQAAEFRSAGADILDLEVGRREKLWDALKSLDAPSDVAPDTVREVGIYSGARGIYVDVERTRSEIAPQGIALAFLDLGVRYSNELSERGVVYHFPSTERPGRDEAEIAATRRAYELGAPVFVITLSAKSRSLRAVHRAFIEEIDEDARTALITFVGEEELPPAPPSDDEAFSLTDEDAETIWTRRRARPNQARFAFKVFQRYGPACAACGLTVRSALEAAHLRSKSSSGVDDERNGLPLCSNHHRMFDAYLWAVNPASLDVVVRPDTSFEELAITRDSLADCNAIPHAEALEHAWRSWRRANDLV